MRQFWLSTTRMTVFAQVDDFDVIVETSPIIRKFIGQRLSNLIRWLSYQPGFQYCEIGLNGETDIKKTYEMKKA